MPRGPMAAPLWVVLCAWPTRVCSSSPQGRAGEKWSQRAKCRGRVAWSFGDFVWVILLFCLFFFGQWSFGLFFNQHFFNLFLGKVLGIFWLSIAFFVHFGTLFCVSCDLCGQILGCLPRKCIEEMALEGWSIGLMGKSLLKSGDVLNFGEWCDILFQELLLLKTRGKTLDWNRRVDVFEASFWWFCTGETFLVGWETSVLFIFPRRYLEVMFDVLKVSLRS